MATITAKITANTLRLHHWSKNLLLFIPLFTAYKFNQPHLVLLALQGFFAFCLCASSVYIINDLVDLSADKQHERKKHRPFAAGDVSVMAGLCLIPCLLFSSFMLARNISWNFTAVLAVYFLVTCAYSFFCKKIAILDVILLATLYVMRVIAGGVAIQVPLSEWLLAFSLFLFLSLAFMKRSAELQHLRKKNVMMVTGRGYVSSDFEQISTLGSCSGYIAVLVFALYINSHTILKLYRQPQILWLCCPILLYWISRAWLLTHREQMIDDPILFALKDKTSYFVGILLFALIYFAK